jgi:hypothetical protein
MPEQYAPHPHHRDNNRRKSQWIVPENEEENAFRHAEAEEWLDGRAGWGFHPPAVQPQQCGWGVVRTEPLYLAKFVRPANSLVWHGWPAQPDRNAADIPSPAVRLKWLTDRPIPVAKLRKLVKGQVCLP